ncbi:GDP-L-fucose synthase family protein [Sphingomonas sp. CJ20]
MTKDAFSLSGKRVWVAGHRGLVGSAIVRRLAREDCEIVTVDRTRLNLLDQQATFDWIAAQKPDAIFLAAAKTGGILANDSLPADFLYQNLTIQANIIEGALRAGTSKLLSLGSSCIYPKLAEQPIVEEALLTAPLEPTNEWYAIAKIAGIKLTQAYRRQYGADFISAMPTNLYGPNDNFDLASSHVLPALMRKAHEARLRGDRHLVIWGTGTPRREFLHADDCANACIFLMKHYSDDMHINIGSGEEVTIYELAEMICKAVGLEGGIVTDPGKPDGTPRKLLNSARLRALGWAPSIDLLEGIGATYRWFLENQSAPV